MTDRTITVTSAAKISLRDRQLVILLPDGEEKTAPLEDLACLMIESQQTTVSTPALIALSENNVSVVFCDGRHSPSAMLLTLHANALQTERFTMQLTLTDDRKDELWRQIVTEKIHHQADLLDMLSMDGAAIRRFAADVCPGDTTGKEAAAAQEYWKLLFGKDFKRERFGTGPNPLLNYGYAILRSAVARSLMSSGLYPCRGIHHRNRYDDFPLADDVMEPYRPYIDLKVYELWNGGHRTTDKEAKLALQETMITECSVRGFRRSLLAAIDITTSSLLDCMKGEKETVLYPD